MLDIEKNVTIKVYHPTGEFIKTWTNAKFVGFTKEINAGLGPCTIELGEEFNYSGNDLELNNEVRVIISDGDNAEKVIYSGYISRYIPWVEGPWEGITVTLLGYYTKLSQDLWQDTKSVPGTYTTTKDYNGDATDIGSVFRTVIDRYNAENKNSKFLYTNQTVATTSTTTEYEFAMLTYREWIDILRKLAPANWWWYVDQDNYVHFQSHPTTATHEFIFGKHFTSVRIERSMEKLKNTVYWLAIEWDGVNTLYKKYSNTLSTADYDRRAIKVRDDRIQDITDADKMAEGFVTEHKDPDIKVTVEIIDNNEVKDMLLGYDIESIDPGDTCTFKGFDETYADVFKENMMITKVDYGLDKATITVEPMRTGIVNRTEYISQRIEAWERDGVPNAFSK